MGKIKDKGKSVKTEDSPNGEEKVIVQDEK